IMMLIDNCEDIECIVDSGSQIISMLAELASDLLLTYGLSTMDQLLGLAHNVPCTIGNIIFYLQIHVLRSPAYNILPGCLFNVLTCSIVKILM
ncbi:hypothetical protein J132_01505, partial [Termitomyces sp. J132]